jgi:Zn finger protein HypA/HybF involved in hydrogenase expression
MKPPMTAGQKTAIVSNKAYFKCSNCGYAKEIEQGTLILSRVPERATSDYIVDKTAYKDMIYDETLPRTRDYTCPNKECKSHDDPALREAVWFKPYKNSYVIVTICRTCQTVW